MKISEIILKKSLSSQDIEVSQRMFSVMSSSPSQFQGLILPLVEILTQNDQEIKSEFIVLCKNFAE